MSTGKTTSTIELAVLAAKQGWLVAIVCGDSQLIADLVADMEPSARYITNNFLRVGTLEGEIRCIRESELTFGSYDYVLDERSTPQDLPTREYLQATRQAV